MRRFAADETRRCDRRAAARRGGLRDRRAKAAREVPGIGWSDPWSFWQFGWPAVMVSDTAPYRNPNYHETSDTPETLDYARMGQVVEGLSAVVENLSGNAPLLK